MIEASKIFAKDPCSSQKRQEMVAAARFLLSTVTRLLIVADMVDVHLLLKASLSVRGLLDAAGQCGPNQDDLLSKRLAAFREPFNIFDKQAGFRASDLLDSSQRDNMQVRRCN
uniref:Uncharacterized protein n=1 Tax=Romanomermis culicivorax TaxID=13658 RepID=A0A915J2A3_ROMCU